MQIILTPFDVWMIFIDGVAIIRLFFRPAFKQSPRNWRTSPCSAHRWRTTKESPVQHRLSTQEHRQVNFTFRILWCTDKFKDVHTYPLSRTKNFDVVSVPFFCCVQTNLYPETQSCLSQCRCMFPCLWTCTASTHQSLWAFPYWYVKHPWHLCEPCFTLIINKHQISGIYTAFFQYIDFLKWCLVRV